MSDTRRGRFVWYELMTIDPQNNLDFYRNVLGWGTQGWDAGANGQPYSMWTAGAIPVGGTMELPQQARDMGAPPHWLTYMSTNDLAASVSLARELGGKVHAEEIPVPTVGKIGVFQDPYGAWFAMLEPEAEMDTAWNPDLGRIVFNELTTPDVDGALAFYAKMMGWHETGSMDMGAELGKYLMVGHDDTGAGMAGFYKFPPGMGEVPPNWLPYVGVGSLEETMERVKSNGGQILNGPMDVPGGRIAQCMDHQGAAFAIHQEVA